MKQTQQKALFCRAIKGLSIFLSRGNRPLRILLFGGVFLAWLIMSLLARLFGIETDIGGDVALANVVLIVVSVLLGFGIAFAVFYYLEAVREDESR